MKKLLATAISWRIAVIPVVILALDAPAQAAERCVEIDSSMSQSVNGEACSGAGADCWSGHIPSGFLHGVTKLRTTGTTETPGVLKGTGTIETSDGELVLDSEVFTDPVNGHRTETHRIVSGSGLFTTARGLLFIQNVLGPSAQHGLGRMQGTICGLPVQAAGARLAHAPVIAKDDAVISPYKGRYRGTYTGFDSGDFVITVGKRGVALGSVHSTAFNTDYSFRGRVNAVGQFSFTGSPPGLIGITTTFKGRINATTGKVRGTWSAVLGTFTTPGTFRGRRLN